jgi:serine/threonine protein kinase
VSASNQRYYPFEVNARDEHSAASDIYSLGIVFYELLSGGKHPFNLKGENPNLIPGHMLDPTFKVVLSHLRPNNPLVKEQWFEAHALIHQMIQFLPEKRPKVEDIMNHAFFVNYTNRHVDIQRVKDAFKEMELGRKINDFVDTQLDSIIDSWRAQFPQEDQHLIPSYKGWDRRFDEMVIDKFMGERKYHTNTFYDLVRFIRNVGQHYKENG